jgi:ubiquitin-protein ligase
MLNQQNIIFIELCNNYNIIILNVNKINNYISYNIKINNEYIINLMTDFDNYCIIENDNNSDLIRKIKLFNLNIIIKEKSPINILNELTDILKQNDEDTNLIYNIAIDKKSFIKYEIDYKKLNECMNTIAKEENEIINRVLSQKQINNLIINEIQKVNSNRDYDDYIIIEYNNPYHLLIKSKVIEYYLILNPNTYPYTPPKFKYIKPNIKDTLYFSLIDLDIFKFENWNINCNIEYIITNIKQKIEPIIDKYLVEYTYSNLYIESLKIASLEKINYIEKIDINFRMSYLQNNILLNILLKDKLIDRNIIEKNINHEITLHLFRIRTLYFDENEIINNKIIIIYIKQKLKNITISEIEKYKDLYIEIYKLINIINYDFNINRELIILFENMLYQIS